MAIQNASDLLVYKITTPAQAQVTRIKVKSSTPLKDFTSGESIILNNVTDADGDITDGGSATVWLSYSANTGTNLLNAIKTELQGTDFGYTGSAVGTDGVWKYIDFTNGANGPVPTLEVVDGTAEFKAGAVVIDVLTSGQSEVYQPIAYSTSASLSMSTDLRDITTKDSQGWQDNAKGLSSFEMSTDALWDVNNAVGVESAINDLDEGAAVDVKFSDRVRNLVATEEVYGEGWNSDVLTVTKHLEDPFGQYTAAKFEIASPTSHKYVSYQVPIQLVEGKKPTVSLYLKGVSGTTGASVNVFKMVGGSAYFTNPVCKKISGAGTIGNDSGGAFPITGLSNTEWTKIEISQSQPISGTDLRYISINLYPGSDKSSQTTADKIITASWQVETGTTATDYQNPTEVDCYQGKALVNSVSVDAGTEDNATYSASFTGTSELFINGLGPELLSNTYLDGAEVVDGTTRTIDGWTMYRAASNCASNFENPGGHLEWNSSANTYFYPAIAMVTGKEYELTYTVSVLSNANTKIFIENETLDIPLTIGTHIIRFINGSGSGNLTFNNVGASGSVTFSHISLKEVFS